MCEQRVMRKMKVKGLHTLAAAASASLFFFRISSILRGSVFGLTVPHPFYCLGATGEGGFGASTAGGGGGGTSSGGGGGTKASGGGGGGEAGLSTGSGGGGGGIVSFVAILSEVVLWT